ncbi:peptidoglycan-N-acetylglucosamine deacetylase [Bacillus cereus]|uniref:peptidoglycan-N-acetylglucosamine deacetylase n=1 Tax=Bacillus cereus group TaxID=86661 RepID=UPI00211CA04A|nr:polysaccharide deacetylase family protein [Bacillus cereus]UUN15363.1 polysaccharide deacetylase [Bacillus cereus]
MKKLFQTKKLLISVLTLTIVVSLYFVLQSTTSLAKDIENQDNPIQLVSEQPNVELRKTVPNQFNGQVRKVAYLTFDDGPGKYTAELLDILKQHNVKATFFLTGNPVKKYPDLVKREKIEGHYVGMHSMTHDFKKLYTNGDYVNEMKANQSLIADLIGEKPQLTRPPYGSMPGLNEKLRNKVVENDFKVWDWTIDSLDWNYNNVPVDIASKNIAQNVLTNANKSQEVILMHDIHPQAIAAVSAIIIGLKEKGYEFEAYHESNHFPLNFWQDPRI